MDLGLKGRVAVVAAASQGLGKAIACGLAREGVKLAICSRREEAIKAAAREISQKTGVAVLPVPCDVTSESEVKNFLEKTVGEFGRIDILVSNAGGPPATTFADAQPEMWEQAVELNLLSTIRLCRAVVPSMKQRQWGRIIAITSIAAKQPIANLILSNTVRAGVHGFCKSLSNELAPYNILVNCVCPGFTKTERLTEFVEAVAGRQGISVEEVFQSWESEIPMGRLAQPEELANAVVFLASERASYITGVSLQVDGGLIRSLM